MIKAAPPLTMPRLYPIIDTSIVSAGDIARVTREILSGGARIIQLRAKGLGARDTLSAAREIRAATIGAEALFIVNDRVDVALMTGADGVHLGQDDMPPKEAREILGEASIIGLSTHGVEEAREAVASGVDYISIGPVFPTDTKADTMAVQGVSGLVSVVSAAGGTEESATPVVAIGGISAEAAQELISAGASSIAMISGILLRKDDLISGEVSRIINLLGGP